MEIRGVVRASIAAVAAGVLALAISGCESGGAGSGGGKTIALLLPESQTTRYEKFDRPLFEAKVKQLCADCKVLYNNAAQDSAKQQQQVNAVLANGANVVVLDPVDGQSAGSMVTTAKAKNAKVIAYDRLIANAKLDYYVSFDNEKIGRLQGQALVDKLKKDGKTSGKIVMINGADTDNNAKLFNKGAHSAMDKSGFQLLPKPDFFTPEWKPENAQKFMDGQIAQLGKTGFVGVYAANDGTAGGAIASLKSAQVKPLPPVTGQDSELAAIQRVVLGEQYMTIYKQVKPEAENAAEAAVNLVNGKPVKGNTTVANGAGGTIPTTFYNAQVVTKENVKTTVVADKVYTTQQICTPEFAAACKAVGLS